MDIDGFITNISLRIRLRVCVHLIINHLLKTLECFKSSARFDCGILLVAVTLSVILK